MRLSEVAPGEPAWPAVGAYLHAQADPVRDLLLWADTASSLARFSRVWLATQGDRPVGVAYAFPLWPDRASVGLKADTPALERAMLEALAAESPRGFVIADADQLPVFATLGTMGERHVERHMVLEAATWAPQDIEGVRPGALAELDAFYREHGAGAWNPVQFGTGPYAVAEVAGRVVAAAGTHFAYPGLAQVGNVLTAPDARGQGHAARLTAWVTQALVAQGYPTVSLFVADGNHGAARIYERLGFRTLRTLVAFTWDAEQAD